jgi:hypothetical protein
MKTLHPSKSILRIVFPDFLATDNTHTSNSVNNIAKIVPNDAKILINSMV